MPADGGRWFALAFGTGHFMLAPGSYIDDFGLRVTVNSIPPDSIRSVDHDSFGGLLVQHRSQGNRGATCGDLGVDVDKALVKALTGNPSDPTLGGRMTGVVALTVTVPHSLDELPALLEQYLERYDSEDYRAHFRWIDHLRHVRDHAEATRLDDILVERLRAGDLDQISMVIPEVLDHEDVEEFTYSPADTADSHDEVALSDFLGTVHDDSEIDISYLSKKRHVYAHRAGGGAPKRWTVYRCLYAEIDDGADTYILSNAKWYRVDRDFVAMVNAEVGAYRVASTLPPYLHGVHDGERGYNVAVAEAIGSPFVLMDRRLIRVGGSDVEVCDLFADDRRMIHVKRGVKSANLSHLFAQGEVPARLLCLKKDFRAAVAKKLGPTGNSLIDVDAFSAEDFTVVYAITTKSKRAIDAALPFFSRMTFARVAQQLRLYGFKVQLMKIKIVDAPVVQYQGPSAHATVGAPPIP